MKKIVINENHGGFGLSHKGYVRFAQLKGIDLNWYSSESQVRSALDLPDRDFTGEKDTIWGPSMTLTDIENTFGKEAAEAFMKKLLDDTDSWGPMVHYHIGQDRDKDLYDRDIARDDVHLIQTIQELGEQAGGRCSSHKIVEIPDDVEWEIQEYDGAEWVAEKHRTWN